MDDPIKPAASAPAQPPSTSRWSINAGATSARASFTAIVAIAFAVGGLAFVAGAAILFATSGGAGDAVSVDELRTELASLREKLAQDTTASSPVKELQTQLTELNRQLADLERKLTAGDPGRIAELEKALRDSEAAMRAGEQALLAKGMRGPLMVFKAAAHRIRGGDPRIGPGPRPGPRPIRPAEPKKVDGEF